jgi:hypothetical protein
MFDDFPGTFSPTQTAQLLAPIRPNRVLRDGKGNSHVSQQDVTAHLIRVFGFGNFATELVDLTLVSEECRNPEETYPRRKWDVVYRAHMRLTIFDEKHNMVTHFEDASCGDAQNQVRHDAHDLAMKSAISLAKKRCTINLGDQFGLSLYNKGQMDPLVRGTLVLPEKPEGTEPPADMQEGVPQQESMGVDEIEKAPAEPDEAQSAQIAKSLGATTVEEREPTQAERDAVAAAEEQAGMPSQQEAGA